MIVNTLIIEGHFVTNSTLSRQQATLWMAWVIVLLSGRAAYTLQVDVLGSIIDLVVCSVVPLAIIMVWTCLRRRNSAYKELGDIDQSSISMT